VHVLVLTNEPAVDDTDCFWESVDTADIYDYSVIAQEVNRKFNGELWPVWSFIEYSIISYGKHDTVTITNGNGVYITFRDLTNNTMLVKHVMQAEDLTKL